jgi:hypothetical protein
VIKEVEKEVIKEVEVEVEKEVIKYVDREVIKEVEIEVEIEVEKEVIKFVDREVIREVPVEKEVVRYQVVPVEVIKEVAAVPGAVQKSDMGAQTDAPTTWALDNGLCPLGARVGSSRIPVLRTPKRHDMGCSPMPSASITPIKAGASTPSWLSTPDMTRKVPSSNKAKMVRVRDVCTGEALEASPAKLCAALLAMHREKEAQMQSRISDLEEMLASVFPELRSHSRGSRA